MKKIAGIIIGCLLLAATNRITIINTVEIRECDFECKYIQIQPNYGKKPPSDDPGK